MSETPPADIVHFFTARTCDRRGSRTRRSRLFGRNGH